MPPISKIPPALHAWVMQRSGEGKTSEEIAAALWAEHKIETTSRSVLRLLEKRSQERGAANEAVAREELRRFVIPAIRRAERAARRSVRIAEASEQRALELRTGPDGHPHHPLALKEDELQLKAGKEIREYRNEVLNFAGINQPDKVTAAGKVSDDELIRRLKALAAEPEPTEPQVH